jgi:hypothetical protein
MRVEAGDRVYSVVKETTGGDDFLAGTVLMGTDLTGIAGMTELDVVGAD